MRHYRRMVPLLIAIAMIAGLLSAYSVPMAVDATPALSKAIETKSGLVTGVSSEDTAVTIFKGIPFAAPPTGANRWKAPQPAAGWEGVRACDTYAPMAMQILSTADNWGPEFYYDYLDSYPVMSEDCLYLNVATAATDASVAADKRPVYVWFHGGASYHGYSYEPEFNPEAFAKKGITVVSVGYRLGLFGYYADSRLDAEAAYGTSGNYGLLDQIAALKWVKENIAAFGGDPDNVTIGGQSAGAGATRLLLTSPLAKGLFNRAIMESSFSVYSNVSTLNTIKTRSSNYMKAKGLEGKTLDELRAVPASYFVNETTTKDEYYVSLGQNLDGYALTKQPVDYFLTPGALDGIDLIYGSNDGEQSPWRGTSPESIEAIRDSLKRTYGNLYDKYAVESMYPMHDLRAAVSASTELNAEQGLMRHRVIGEILSVLGKNPYVYYFDHWPSNSTQPGHDAYIDKAWHSSELWYVFNSMRDIPQHRAWTAEDKELAETVNSMWANFIKTGNPNGPGLPEWPAMTNENKTFLEIGKGLNCDIKAKSSLFTGYWENRDNMLREYILDSLGARDILGDYVTGGFTAGTVAMGESSLGYRLFDPIANVGVSAEGKYPLVLYLHGEGGSGSDNVSQLSEAAKATFWTDSDLQAKNPSFMLAPQCPSGKTWSDEGVYTLVMKALNDIIAANPAVDTNRLYIVGISMGGDGVWDYILKNPTKFAAAGPFSAKIDKKYYDTPEIFKGIANMAIWVNHAADDDVVPVAEMNNAIAAVKAAGGVCIKSETFAAGSCIPAHNSWQKCFTGLTWYNWIFEQSLTRSEGNTKDPGLKYTIQKLADGVTSITDQDLGLIHVIEDDKRAIVIDTGMGRGDLYQFIRDNVLKNKEIPIDLLITHNSGDHWRKIPDFVGHDQLKNVYVNWRERSTYVTPMGQDIEKLITINDGHTWEIGGGTIEAVELYGHATGSQNFFYDKLGLVFTGDSIGSGDVWLQSSEWSMEEYLPRIQHMVERMGGRPYTIMPGHNEFRTLFDETYVYNMVNAVKGRIDGTLVSREYHRRAASQTTYENANLITTLSRVYNTKNATAVDTLVSGYAANVAVRLNNDLLLDKDVTVTFLGKTEKAENGVAIFRFTKDEVPAVTENKVESIRINIDGVDSQWTLKVTIVPKNNDIWKVTLVKAGAQTRFEFAAEISAGSKGFSATNGKDVFTPVQDGNALVIAYAAAEGDVFTVSGVKYAGLFPSYTFTFSGIK